VWEFIFTGKREFIFEEKVLFKISENKTFQKLPGMQYLKDGVDISVC